MGKYKLCKVPQGQEENPEGVGSLMLKRHFQEEVVNTLARAITGPKAEVTLYYLYEQVS